MALSTTIEGKALFDEVLVNDLIVKVEGKSSLAKLAKQVPIAFTGNKEFIFTMDSEIDVVAENGKKTAANIDITPIVMTPIKVEYGARVSDEFLYASQEERINILKAFNEGFAKKLARGLDLMAFHGVNPRTGNASAVIGQNNFDALVDQEVTYTIENPDSNIEASVGMILANGGDISGLAMAPQFATALSQMTNGTNGKIFPELAWGAVPETLNGLPIDVNRTVSDIGKYLAIVGDFQNMFRWGYAKQIPLEIIKYGDPDNTDMDLRGYNQVYLRVEAFLGWGILDAKSFARVTEGESA